MNMIESKIFWSKVSIWTMGKPYLFRIPNYKWRDKSISDSNVRLLSQHIWKEIVIWNQYHSSQIVKIDQENRDNAVFWDALITRLSDVAIFVLASDCVPILLYDEHGWCIWAIHAGRKWLENNIICKTLKKFAWDVSQIQTFIGPCISWKHYELGYNEIKCFQREYYEQIETSKNNSDKYYLDIREIAYTQLLKSWIERDNISISSECTYENIEKYHSYRRHTHKAEEYYWNNAFGIWFNN